jgi:tetratricopeptide (TPR) repeat protein
MLPMNIPRVPPSFAPRSVVLALALLALLAGCATPPPAAPEAASLTSATPEQIVALIRASGEAGDELAVQPLRDPGVEDLRQTATRLEARRQYAEAAAALDQALDIVADDPALLQERAELALLLRQYDDAEQRARRADALGSQVGPLCRRHWATVRQVRLLAGDADGASSAAARVEACTVAAPNRF